MPAITIPDVDEAVVARLEDRAKAGGRTLEAEIRAILEAAVPPPDPDWWERARRIQDELAASGRVFSDSAELIREDRDR